MKKEIQFNLFLISIFTNLSLITGLLITFTNSNILISKDLLENLFLFCIASFIIFCVLLIFQLYSSKWSNSTQPSMLFTRIKALTVLVLVLIISFVWLNWTSIKATFLAKKESLLGGFAHLASLMILLVIILIYLSIDNKTEIGKQKKEILNQLPYFKIRASDNEDGTILESLNNLNVDGNSTHTTPNRKYLEESNIRPHTYLPPSVVPYGLRTVYNFPSKLQQDNKGKSHPISKSEFDKALDNKDSTVNKVEDRSQDKSHTSQEYEDEIRQPQDKDELLVFDTQEGAQKSFDHLRTVELKKQNYNETIRKLEKMWKLVAAKKREEEEIRKQKEKENAKKAATPTTGFSFGNTGTKPATTGFSFGTSNTGTATTGTKSTTTGFSFSPTTTTNTTGATAAAGTKPAAPGFNFTMPNTGTATTGAKPATTGFSFPTTTTTKT